MSLPISLWAAEDRPSDKMHDLGLHALTNAELLSIVIGSGSDSASAVDTARLLLAKHENSLRRLLMCDKDKLSSVRGIGKSKASKILAALELGNRLHEERVSYSQKLDRAVLVYNYMLPRLYGLDTEEFWAVYCNQHYGVIKTKRLFVGGITEVLVDVRLVIKEALMCNATIFYVVHNHPSGSLSPSKSDDAITLDIKRAADVMRLHFQDHIIVTDGEYYSFHEEGKI
ncbi:MAG: DNA repair protein RadC [Prevotella sp.]|nr:DNA repair protein RadC [Prevotella sp.]MBR1527657.1 DNA repair protein RadC [Prevotella sp.]